MVCYCKSMLTSKDMLLFVNWLNAWGREIGCLSFITATAIETRGITVWLNHLLTLIYQDPGNPLLSIQVHLVFVLAGSRSVG